MKPQNSEPNKSKAFLVLSNKRGTRAKKIEIKGVFSATSEDSPDDYLSPMAVVYEHDHAVYGDRELPNLVGIPLFGTITAQGAIDKLMTVIDAMFMDNKQRNALKYLLKKEYYEYVNTQEISAVQTYQATRLAKNAGL